ncbi:uncharacterized protein C8A04DRAFT_10495 [Dichotomopilus funicola]|uniref:RNase H type-1 domain-containing protein n=1 Tax=Dichotomopilus funicola TaxID=1934379 RepID=A0AAN6ZQM0_9PEZI|nr:hypothetical protein C8A04DRAFT_10495 [Dichotomopilus funicola]
MASSHCTPVIASRTSSRTSSSRRNTSPPPAIQLATIFHSHDPDLAPEAHFPPQLVSISVSTPARQTGGTISTARVRRFVNRFNNREILLAVDGSCVNNGRHADKLTEPVGGCAFMFRAAISSPSSSRPSRTSTTLSNPAMRRNHADNIPDPIAFRYETSPESTHKNGPEPTSNRAKLRAVIAALEFRPWGQTQRENWHRVIILTDLEYVVFGATRWLPQWVARHWRKPRNNRGSGPGGRWYGNRDLWEALQRRVEELREGGCEVSFWLVGRGGGVGLRGGDDDDEDGWDEERGGQGREDVVGQVKTAARRAARARGDELEELTSLYDSVRL